MTYEIVVTEVTLYGSRLRCVAGYDRERGEMIRPEPEAAGFWPQIVCGPATTFHPGHVVRFQGRKPETAWPHRTEDVVISGDPYWAGTLDSEAFRAVLRKTEHLTARLTFGGNLAFEGRRAFVPAGASCGSLACETMNASDLRLADDAFKDQHKLRVRVVVDGHVLELPVAAKDFKQAFLKDGVEAARALLPTKGRVQVRLGLARPFDEKPDKCYLQVNGIHAL
jgi:hypothetical protein